MKDRWINVGSDEDELKPFTEPELDISDQKRIGTQLLLLLLIPPHRSLPQPIRVM